MFEYPDPPLYTTPWRQRDTSLKLKGTFLLVIETGDQRLRTPRTAERIPLAKEEYLLCYALNDRDMYHASLLESFAQPELNAGRASFCVNSDYTAD